MASIKWSKERNQIVKLKTTILELVAIIAVGTNTTIHS
jgi:hypothetical protein